MLCNPLEEQVLASEMLINRSGGLKCEFDGYDRNHEANWSAWTERMITESDFVLYVCSRKLSNHFRNPTHELVEMMRGKFWADAIFNHVDATKFIPVFLNSSFEKAYVPSVLQAATHFELRVRELSREMEDCPEDHFVQRLGEFLGRQEFCDIARLLALLRNEQFTARPQQPSQPVKIPQVLTQG